MRRQTRFVGACKIAILAGMLSATAAYAQSGSPPGSDLSPAKSNCDSTTGCANYATGSQTSQNPAAEPRNATSPYSGDPSPAKSNCDTATGCANYETGQPTKQNPTQPSTGQQKK